MLKQIVFPGWSLDDKPVPNHVLAWGILFSAMNNFPPGRTREDTKRRNRVFRLVRDNLGEPGDGEMQFRMRLAGGSIQLDEAEFRDLNEALTAARERLTLGVGDALEWLDDLLANAPAIDPNKKE